MHSMVIATPSLRPAGRRRRPSSPESEDSANSSTEPQGPAPESKPITTMTATKRRFSRFRNPSFTAASASALRRRTGSFLRRSAPASSFVEEHRQSAPPMSSDESSALLLYAMKPTKIVVEQSPQQLSNRKIVVAEAPTTVGCESATAILQHSFRFCGTTLEGDDDDDEQNLHSSRKQQLPDDPTVQESIECIFASQLQAGLPQSLFDEDDDEDEESDDNNEVRHPPPPPSSLQQSILKTRSEAVPKPQLNKKTTPIASSSRKWKGSLLHVGTYDPANTATTASPQHCDNIRDLEPSTLCTCHTQTRPLLLPIDWPQRPLLLRPSGGTRITGVRFSGSTDYLWQPPSTTTWAQALHQHWGTPSEKAPQSHTYTCPLCCIIPINNGNEPNGSALVADFETEFFQGTLLVRVRQSEGTTQHPYDDSVGYFAGMNRRYQAVIQGHFKQPTRLTACVTGFQLERPCGKLPPKWIVKSALKVISFFAPQLSVQLENRHPYSWTPLGSTPQCFIINNKVDIEAMHSEPSCAEHSLLEASDADTSLQRARVRKRAFDKLFVTSAEHPQLGPETLVTVEFLQHLFDFQNFRMELGFSTMQLKEILHGQGLPIMGMAGHDRPLWAFEVWHEDLYEDAKAYDDGQQQSQQQQQQERV